MYDNATKQTWRGWAWNQLSKRLPPGSTVMVLAGDAGLDYEHARKRGFDCVGVDVVKECVDNFRKNGGVAVHDKLHRQLLSIKPDGAILDMLGGITPTSFGSPWAASLVCKAVVWNGLRGRDKGIGEVADSLFGQSGPDYTSGRYRTSVIGRHRGRIAFHMIASSFWGAYMGEDVFQIEGQKKTVRRSLIPVEVVDMLGHVMKPAFNSYRSKDSGQFFDSVAWTNMQDVTRSVRKIAQLNDSTRCKKSRRKSAAAKALLTMRRTKN